jgi:hypothetical protein
MEPHAATVVREHAVQHERVQMDVEIQRATEALDDHHGPAAAIGDAVAALAAPEELEHRTDGHAVDRASQVVIPGQQVTQPMRQAQDPLTHWHVGKDSIDQVRGPLGHSASAAAWAESTPLAREAHELIVPAARAPKAGKSRWQDSRRMVGIGDRFQEFRVPVYSATILRRTSTSTGDATRVRVP